jgi:hypothetical protein
MLCKPLETCAPGLKNFPECLLSSLMVKKIGVRFSG